MIVENIALYNYRNYPLLNLKFNKKLNIIIGNNGEGKTNILESIYVLAITKSFRDSDVDNLIMHDQPYGIVKCNVSNQNQKKELKIEFYRDKSNKKIYLDDKQIKTYNDYLASLNVILFSQNDMDIIRGTPANKRKYLNVEIGQTSSKYIRIVNEYNKYLKQRNDLLKKYNFSSESDKILLDILTSKLVDEGCLIYTYRNNYINDINSRISDIFEFFTGISGLKIRYINSISFSSFDLSVLKGELSKKFSKNIFKETTQGSTLYGPHRDDFIFEVDQRDLSLFGSQGQQRLAIIALKLSEIELLKNCTGCNPVILLDDIFSELDKSKRNKLLDYINKNVQTIITTTDIKNINKKYLKNAKVVTIKNGSVFKEEVELNGK